MEVGSDDAYPGDDLLLHLAGLALPRVPPWPARVRFMGGKSSSILLQASRWPMLSEQPDGWGFHSSIADPPASAVPHFGGMNVAISHFVGTRDGHASYHRMEAADGNRERASAACGTVPTAVRTRKATRTTGCYSLLPHRVTCSLQPSGCRSAPGKRESRDPSRSAPGCPAASPLTPARRTRLLEAAPPPVL
jgi:hypothetical protein